jgi:hypothetical protein
MKTKNQIAIAIALIAIALAPMFLLVTAPRRSCERFLKLVAEVQVGKPEWRIGVHKCSELNLQT